MENMYIAHLPFSVDIDDTPAFEELQYPLVIGDSEAHADATLKTDDNIHGDRRSEPNNSVLLCQGDIAKQLGCVGDLARN